MMMLRKPFFASPSSTALMYGRYAASGIWNAPGYASIEPVIPYGTAGAIIAFSRGASSRAIASGAVMSAPLFATPCGSSVPVGNSTVRIFDGTSSRNSIQLIRAMSRSCARAVRVKRRRSAAASLRIHAAKS